MNLILLNNTILSTDIIGIVNKYYDNSIDVILKLNVNIKNGIKKYKFKKYKIYMVMKTKYL